MNKNELIDLKDGKEKLASFFKDDKKLKIIVVIGVIGMALLLLSEYWPSGNTDKNKSSKASSSVQQTSASNYETEMENRLKNIISKISGVGKCDVMITLENGIESVYAKDSKIDTDNSKSYDSSGKEQTDEQSTDESNYVIIKAESGSEEALIVKQIQPQIKGVIVVCEGGDQAIVQNDIINAVTAAFDISSAKVFISKISTQ